MNPDEVEHAKHLYVSGWSSAKIGLKLGFSDAIRRALRKAGVRMRDCHGREKLHCLARLPHNGETHNKVVTPLAYRTPVRYNAFYMSASDKITIRKEPSERTKYQVWGASAGRCTFCNRSVLENDDLGEPVPIGELAHTVGATTNSPRGNEAMDGDRRAEADNLILACRNCHKPIDDGGVVGRWTVEQLTKLKREHEERIRLLTEIGANRATYLVRMVSHVRGVAPELTRATVLTAATAAGLYPQRLPGAHFEDVELDLRVFGEQDTPEDFARCLPAIDGLVNRVLDGVRRDAIERVAIFAFARIPLLVYLGARLDDKVPTQIFQRHREDGANAWRWPINEPTAPAFEVRQLQAGTDRTAVALVMSLSGTIDVAELPAEIDERFFVYEIRPSEPSTSGPGLISSAAALAAVEYQLRRFLANVERDHGKIESLHVFPAIGVATAVTFGRVLMPHVSPSLVVYDRDKDRRFFRALDVRR